jgi:hypothetical protein
MLVVNGMLIRRAVSRVEIPGRLAIIADLVFGNRSKSVSSESQVAVR